ncbi:unnamed protein product [Moneuplotes crassus]|uniref:F-box domain-containing protein n=1 Tax=Euplotes crassus TaxID=5936 RepID=A0AAD1XAJ0_EUPCR|nr:unnamed protein product [Moneuplotes crassus]
MEVKKTCINPFEVFPSELILEITFKLPPEDIVNLWDSSGLWKTLFVLSNNSLRNYTYQHLGIEGNLKAEKEMYSEYNDIANSMIDGIQEQLDQSDGYYDQLSNCINTLRSITKSKKFSLLLEGFYTDGGVCLDLEKFEVYHCFTPTTEKVFSSTLSCPIAVSAIHRPNYDHDTWKLIQERIQYFKKFINFMKEEHPHADEYTLLFWFFEQITDEPETIKYKIDKAIIKGYIDYPPYREVIKAQHPRIREAQIKNKIGEEILHFYYAFCNAYKTKVHESKRDRPIQGIDTINTVEYNINSILTTHQALSYYACFDSLRIIRPVDYTNPTKTFAIFLHNQKLTDYEIQECKEYFINFEDYLGEFNPKQTADFETPETNMTVHEIDQSKLFDLEDQEWTKPYRPLLLARFTTRQGRHSYINFKQGFVSSRFVTTIFLECENLSKEVNRSYDPSTNLDNASIQVYGFSIPSLIFSE